MEYIKIALLYIVFGTIFAYPYCSLIGWDTYSFFAVVVAMPIILAIGFCVIEEAEILTGVSDRDPDDSPIRIDFGAMVGNGRNRPYVHSGCEPRPGPIPITFWVYVFYIASPIILYWTSLIVGAAGFEKYAALLYSYRYLSLLFLPVLGIICFLIFMVIVNTYCYFEERF